MTARSSKRSAAVVRPRGDGLAADGRGARADICLSCSARPKLSDVFIAAFRIPKSPARSLRGGRALHRLHHHFHQDMGEGRPGGLVATRADRPLHPHPDSLGIICLLGIAFAPWVVEYDQLSVSTAPMATTQNSGCAVAMTRLLFPFILFVSLAALAMGMLNARNVFGLPASASTIFNIVSVVSGALLAWAAEPHQDWRHPHFGEPALYGWCFGVLLGGVAQLAVQIARALGTWLSLQVEARFRRSRAAHGDADHDSERNRGISRSGERCW